MSDFLSSDYVGEWAIYFYILVGIVVLFAVGIRVSMEEDEKKQQERDLREREIRALEKLADSCGNNNVREMKRKLSYREKGDY